MPEDSPPLHRPYRRNHYRLLHVQPEAPVEVIKASYRTLMSRLKMHPDLGGNHEDAALLNEAYAVLCDPVLRADYDRQLRWRQRLDLMRARITEGHAPAHPAGSSAPVAETSTGRATWGASATHHAAARSARHYQGTEPSSPPAHMPSSRLHCAFCGTVNPMARNDCAALCSRCGAPLSPVRMMQVPHFRAIGQNRRAAARRPRDHDTVAYWGSPPRRHVVRWRDLSANGLSLWSPVALGAGLRLHLVDQDIQTVAEVVSCEPQRGPQEIWLIRARLLTLRAIRRNGLFCSTQA